MTAINNIYACQLSEALQMTTEIIKKLSSMMTMTATETKPKIVGAKTPEITNHNLILN